MHHSFPVYFAVVCFLFMGLAGVLALRDALKRQNTRQRLSIFSAWIRTPDGLERMVYYVVLAVGIPVYIWCMGALSTYWWKNYWLSFVMLLVVIPLGLVVFVALPADYLGKIAVWLAYRKKR